MWITNFFIKVHEKNQKNNFILEKPKNKFRFSTK